MGALFLFLVLTIVVVPEQAQCGFSFVMPRFTPRMPKFSLPEISLPKMEYNFPKMPEYNFPKMPEYNFPKMPEYNFPKMSEFSPEISNWHPEHVPKIENENFDFIRQVETMRHQNDLQKILDSVPKRQEPLNPEHKSLPSSKNEQTLPKHEETPNSKPKQKDSKNKEKSEDIEDALAEAAEDVLDVVDELSDGDSDEDDQTEGSTNKPESENGDVPVIKFRRHKKRGHKNKRKYKRIVKKIKKKISEAIDNALDSDDPGEQNSTTLYTEDDSVIRKINVSVAGALTHASNSNKLFNNRLSAYVYALICLCWCYI